MLHPASGDILRDPARIPPGPKRAPGRAVTPYPSRLASSIRTTLPYTNRYIPVLKRYISYRIEGCTENSNIKRLDMLAFWRQAMHIREMGERHEPLEPRMRDVGIQPVLRHNVLGRVSRDWRKRDFPGVCEREEGRGR